MIKLKRMRIEAVRHRTVVSQNWSDIKDRIISK